MGKQQRSKNLRAADIETIVRMLDGWTGELTWNALIDAIHGQKKASVRYSRQALHLHEPVRLAYQRNKKRLREARITREKELRKLVRAEGSTLFERFTRLQAENARLKAENECFLRQFVTSVSESMANDRTSV